MSVLRRATVLVAASAAVGTIAGAGSAAAGTIAGAASADAPMSAEPRTSLSEVWSRDLGG